MTAKTHFFVSYSRRDAHMADRIVHTLRRAGIPIWVDRVGIEPGTPSWELEISQALDQALGVVYLASPDSRASKVVLAELAFADAIRCPIFPVWIAGDDWARATPLTLIQAQYVDARRDNYSTALEQLTARLQQVISSQAEVESSPPPPDNRLSIELDDGTTALIEMDVYPGIDDFLIHLCERWLPNHTVSSYGIKWVLAQTTCDPRWEVHYPFMRVGNVWDVVDARTGAMSLGLANLYGFLPNTRWKVMLPADIRPILCAGLRLETLCPGLMPSDSEAAAEKVIKAGSSYFSDLESATRSQRVIPQKSLKQGDYTKGFDLFMLHDVYHRFPSIQNQAVVFQRKKE